MTVYEIDYEPKVLKQLQALPQADQERATTRIRTLAEDARPVGCEKLVAEINLWRIRTGNYRIVYRIDDQAAVITIVRVAHRREVYRR